MDYFKIILGFSICIASCIGEDGCIIDDSVSMKDKKIAEEKLKIIAPFYQQDLSAVVEEKYVYNFRVCGDSKNVNQDENLKFSTITRKDLTDNTIVSLGRRNRTLVHAGNNWVMLTFLDGTPYPNGTCNNETRKTYVLFACDENENDITMNLIEDTKLQTNCHSMFEVTHRQFCTRTPHGLSGGAIFLLIILIGFGCYFLFGFLYLRMYVGAKGVEQVPHREFWMRVGNAFANCCDMVCRCEKYCDQNPESFTPNSHNGYSPIGEQPRPNLHTIDSDSSLINP